MFSRQKSNIEKIELIRAKIAKEQNGSLHTCNTTHEKPDARIELFHILNQVDTF